MSTVKRLVEILESTGLSQSEAAEAVYMQMEAGEIRFVDPKPPRTYQGYLLSLYSAWFWLVAGALVSMALTIYVLPQNPPVSWLRVGLGFLTSLYLPGFTFIEALYPKQDELEELERFALGVGLSLALTPLVGFVLNYTPWGIRLAPITVAISLLTLVFGVIGVYRKYQYHMLSLELIEVG
jgi:uncharacterized membrane protein